MREFEHFCYRPERVRKDLSLAYSILEVLVGTEMVACSFPQIIAWYDELQERQGVQDIRHLSPREIQVLVRYGCEREAVPPGKRIWGIRGVGYVCTRAEITPKTLGEIDVSVFCSALSRSPGFLVIPEISLLSENGVRRVINPSPERVVNAFNALCVVRRNGQADFLKPDLVGVGRQLVASLANAGGGELTMRDLISGLGRDFIPGDDSLIRTKFKEMRVVLESYGLGIRGKREYLGRKKGTPGSSTYCLHNL